MKKAAAVRGWTTNGSKPRSSARPTPFGAVLFGGGLSTPAIFCFRSPGLDSLNLAVRRSMASSVRRSGPKTGGVGIVRPVEMVELRFLRILPHPLRHLLPKRRLDDAGDMPRVRDFDRGPIIADLLQRLHVEELGRVAVADEDFDRDAD